MSDLERGAEEGASRKEEHEPDTPQARDEAGTGPAHVVRVIEYELPPRKKTADGAISHIGDTWKPEWNGRKNFKGFRRARITLGSDCTANESSLFAKAPAFEVLPLEILSAITKFTVLPLGYDILPNKLLTHSSNSSVESSLRAVNKQSRSEFLRCIATEYTFVEVLICHCGTIADCGHDCQTHAVDEIETYFGAPQTNESLMRLWRKGAVKLSFISLSLACSHTNCASTESATKLAFFMEVNEPTMLLLASVLRGLNPTAAVIRCQAHSRATDKAITGVLEIMVRYVFRRVPGAKIVIGLRPSPCIVSREMMHDNGPVTNSSVRVIQFLEAHLLTLQILIDTGLPGDDVLDLIITFWRAYSEVISVSLAEVDDRRPRDGDYIKDLILNYVYIVLNNVSQHMLAQDLDADQQYSWLISKHRMWAVNTAVQVAMNISQDPLPDDHAMCQNTLSVLRKYYPIFRAGAQLEVARARLFVSARGHTEAHFTVFQTREAMVQNMVRAAKRDLTHVYWLLNHTDDTSGGSAQDAKKEGEALHWMLSMYGVIGRIEDAAVERRMTDQRLRTFGLTLLARPMVESRSQEKLPFLGGKEWMKDIHEDLRAGRYDPSSSFPQ